VVWINDLASNTTQNLSVEGQWWKPIAESEKPAIEACKLQSTEGGIPRSTSWIMSWCRQEAIRHRRALMNPTSVTRKGANDFMEVKTDWRYEVQDGGHEWMKHKCIVVGGSGWTLWMTSLEHVTTLTWWIGSITPDMDGVMRPWWSDRWMKKPNPTWMRNESVMFKSDLLPTKFL